MSQSLRKGRDAAHTGLLRTDHVRRSSGHIRKLHVVGWLVDNIAHRTRAHANGGLHFALCGNLACLRLGVQRFAELQCSGGRFWGC